MGLTINYRLSLKNAQVDQVREKIDLLRKIALKMPFSHVGKLVEVDEDNNQLENDDGYLFLKLQGKRYVEIENDNFTVIEPKYLIGFETLPGEGSEYAGFGLATHSEIDSVNDWCWMSFCKTQYASNPKYGGIENFLKCHLMIVKLLDEAKKIGIIIEVIDEGDYWETRNIEELVNNVGEWNTLIAAFAGKIADELSEVDFTNISAPIFDYPNFEYLEAEGNEG